MNNDGPIFPTGRKKSNLKQNEGPVISKEKGASPSVEGEGPVFPTGRSVKKKSTMVSPSEQNQGDVSLATSTTEIKKPSVSSGSESKLYSAPNSTAVFKKVGNDWYTDVNRNGNFKQIQQGDIKKKSEYLDKVARPLFDADYEKSITWKPEAAPVVSKSTGAQTKTDKKQQQLFKKDFEVLEKNDPIVLERNRVEKISKEASNYVNKTEEQTVEDLRNKFRGTPDDIFDFEETGVGNMLKITNKKTDQTITVDLDGSETEKNILGSFIESNLSFKKYNDLVEKRKNITNQLSSGQGVNTQSLEQELSDVNKEIKKQEFYRKGYALSKGKYASAAMYGDKKIKDADKSFNENTSRLIANAVILKDEIKKDQEFDNEIKEKYSNGEITLDQYNSIVNDEAYVFKKQNIKDKLSEINEEKKTIGEDRDLMEKVIAEKALANEDRGDAASNILAGFANGFIQTTRALKELHDYTETPVYDSKGNRIYNTDVLSKEDFNDILPGIITEEYISSNKRGDLEKTIAGIAESLGAAASIPIPGAGQAVAVEGALIKKTGTEIIKNITKKALLSPSQIGMAASSYMNFKDQINSDPDTAKISEADKVLLSGAYGYVSSKLESFGMSKWFTKTPVGGKVTSWIISKAFKDLPKDASKEAIDNAINSNVKTLITKGVLNLTAKGNVEGTTEALQEMADIGLKEAYNAIEEKDIFKNGTYGEMLDRVSESYKLGLLGGALMSSIPQVLQTTRETRTSNQVKQIEGLAKDPAVKEVFEKDLKYKVLNGQITTKQAQDQVQELNESIGLLKEIPDNIEDKTQSFKLLAERKKIEKEIDGKDESLIYNQKARIEEINNELKTIGENATKESNKQEVSTEGYIVQREGTDEGQQEIGQGEGAVGETEKPSADTGDSNISSQEEIEKNISLSGLNEGAIMFSNNAFDVRGSNEVYDKMAKRKSFVTKIERKGKNYIVAGLKIKGVNGTTLGRDGYTIATIEDDGNLPDNISDILIKKAIENTSNVYKDIKDSTIDSFEKVDLDPNLNIKKTSEVTTKEAQQPVTKTINPSKETENLGRISELESKLEEGGLSEEEAFKIQDEIETLKDPNIDNEGFIKSEYEDSTDNTTSQDKYSTKVSPTGKSVEVKNNQDGTVKKNQRIITGEDGRRFVYENGDKSKKIYIPNPKKTAIESEVEAISEFISGTDAEINKKVSRIKNKRIARSVSRAAKALSNVLPEVKIKVHATQEEYNQAVGDKGKFSNGKFDSKTNIIHINSVNANARTVAHEVFHAVLLNKVKTNANAQDITKKLVDAIAQKIDKNPSLKKYLDDFSSQYESNLQNEEKLAEFIGKLAENYNSFTTPIKDIITRWINKLADMFGLERTNDTYDALKTIAGKIASGKEITESDVEIIPSSEEIADANSRFQADFIDPASKVEFVYDKNTEKFKALEEEGYITKDKSISDFNGKTIFLHQPDAAFSGMIYKNGELLVEGKDGVYYPIKFHEDGYFWASTKSAAEKMAKDLNKVYKENGGKILMALTTAPSNKLLSSTTASNGVMEIIISKAFDKNFSINQTQVKQSLLDAANKFVIRKTAIVDKNTKEPILDSKGNKQYRMKEVGLKLNLKPGLSIDDIKSEISKKLDPEKSSFDDRKFFAESLISNVANIIKENPKAEDQFVKFFSEGIKNESFKASPRSKKDGGGFKISATNLKQGISEMLTEPLLKTGVDRTKGGQVYAILEVDGMVKDVDSDKHESYPKAIEADGKVKLHILTDRVTWSDVFEDFKTKKIVTEDRFKKVYPSSGVSVRGLKLNTDSLSRDQLNIDDTIKKLKDQGFTDAAIKKYLENQGIKGSQSQEAIRRYNAVKDNVFLNDPKTGLPKIAQSIKKWSKDQLTTKGSRTNSMFEAQENMEGAIAEALNKVVRISKDFNKVYNAIPKDLREKFLENYDAYLRGNKKVDISDDAKIVANEMRNQIDALSRNIINAGIAPLKVAKEIQENLGSYLTRSYEVFKNKDYKAKEEIVQRAKNLLMKQNLNEAKRIAKIKGTEVDFELNRLVNNKIDKYTNKISADEFLGGGKLGSKSKELGVFKERTNIPIEIRQLMGEFTDPVQNYAETVMKLSALSAKNDFLNKIKDTGMGVYLFTEKTRPEGYNVMIAAPGSDAMNPLNGLYTTPEIAKEFNNLPGELGKLMKIYMKAISMIKWGKTIGSVMTHAKNLFGNLGFVAVNGHTSGAVDAFKAIYSDISNSSNEEIRKRIDKYIELGIMKQSAGIGEIRDMFKDADFDKSLAERLSKRPSIKKKPIASVLGRGKRIAKSIGSAAETAYQAEDDFFKVLAYESELRRYAKAEFNKDVKDLTDSERSKIDATVANIVKDTMPTFSRIPKIVKTLRKSPLLGNFISFQAESYRTAFKTMQLAKSEITSKNPAIRAIGARRVIGTLTYLSAKNALLSFYGSAFGMGLAGLAGYFGDDDDEKEKEKDLRKFLPPWSTQSDIIPIKNSDGTITYIDMSASDPHGGIGKAFNAFFGGDDPIDGAKEAMFSIFKPFLEPEMTAKAMFNLVSGTDNYDRPIWNSEDDWNGIAGNIAEFAFGIAQPGTVTSALRISNSEDKLKEVIGASTGYRPIKIDVGESFGYRVYDYRDRLDKAKELYSSISRNEKATDEEKEKALEKANSKTEEIYKQLMEDYNSAERLGVDSGKLRTELKDKLNLSDKNLKIILSGGYAEVKPKEAERRKIIFR